MIFEGPESKSGRAFEIAVPENLVPFFEYYLREVRPKFTGADQHNGSWASTKGGPLTANAIARVITERTREAFRHRSTRICSGTAPQRPSQSSSPAGVSRETFLGMPR